MVLCSAGHNCSSKRVSGGIFGITKRRCETCGRTIGIGDVRHTCQTCSIHYCDGCAESWTPGPPSSPQPARASRASSSGVVREACKFGAECYNRDPEHRRRFAHPADDGGGQPGKRLACKYGEECYRKEAAHREQYVHPGDRNYRNGLVVFKAGQKPEFHSLWQVFQFYDPDESGHLSRDEFAEAISGFAEHQEMTPPPASQAWQDAGGPLHGYVNFRQFAAWTKDHLSLDYPLGLDEKHIKKRPCRFRILSADGKRCSCEGFEAADASESSLCVCGHKASMHRSDCAERTYSAFIEDSSVSHWTEGEEGLVRISDDELLGKLQALLTASHKTSDNWTRDRGCSLHGVNGCAASCASRNRVSVPTGYRLIEAYRNQNQDLWTKYTMARSAISEECARPCKDAHEAQSVATSGRVPDEGAELDEANNEWYLFHGSSPPKCKGICSTNFRLAMAGSGATWKDAGKTAGTPLYGFGIYLAERVTKADEYSSALPAEEDQMHPIIPKEDGDGEIFTVLLCRVMGGRTNIVTTNEIEVDKLRKDVFEGSYNSVFGDRVASLGKPFREVVVYDKDQCYPEFLLAYARVFE